jgi:hypothetical protein
MPSGVHHSFLNMSKDVKICSPMWLVCSVVEAGVIVYYIICPEKSPIYGHKDDYLVHYP